MDFVKSYFLQNPYFTNLEVIQNHNSVIVITEERETTELFGTNYSEVVELNSTTKRFQIQFMFAKNSR